MHLFLRRTANVVALWRTQYASSAIDSHDNVFAVIVTADVAIKKRQLPENRPSNNDDSTTSLSLQIVSNIDTFHVSSDFFIQPEDGSILLCSSVEKTKHYFGQVVFNRTGQMLAAFAAANYVVVLRSDVDAWVATHEIQDFDSAEKVAGLLWDTLWSRDYLWTITVFSSIETMHFTRRPPGGAISSHTLSLWSLSDSPVQIVTVPAVRVHGKNVWAWRSRNNLIACVVEFRAHSDCFQRKLRNIRLKDNECNPHVIVLELFPDGAQLLHQFPWTAQYGHRVVPIPAVPKEVVNYIDATNSSTLLGLFDSRSTVKHDPACIRGVVMKTRNANGTSSLTVLRIDGQSMGEIPVDVDEDIVDSAIHPSGRAVALMLSSSMICLAFLDMPKYYKISPKDTDVLSQTVIPLREETDPENRKRRPPKQQPILMEEKVTWDPLGRFLVSTGNGVVKLRDLALSARTRVVTFTYGKRTSRGYARFLWLADRIFVLTLPYLEDGGTITETGVSVVKLGPSPMSDAPEESTVTHVPLQSPALLQKAIANFQQTRSGAPANPFLQWSPLMYLDGRRMLLIQDARMGVIAAMALIPA